jgi:AhpD family alkylhydroperoxidase
MWARITRAIDSTIASAIDATMARQIRRVRPVVRPFADPLTRRVAAQIARDFGAFVPPFALHAAAPSVLAACWTILREALVTTHVDRRRKEAVASAVSRANACTYCVDAHTAALHALGDVPTADALALPEARIAADDPLAALVGWAEATRTADDPRLRLPPFTPAEAPELTAIVCCFHYINRMVAIFLVPSPMPFTSSRLKAIGRRALAPVLTGQLQRQLPAGDALSFLPEAELPPDLAWAAPHATLAAAFARAAATIETAGAAVLPAVVRAQVEKIVGEWRGEAPGLGRAWLAEAVAPLTEPDRPAARLALLTALAPFQVDDATIAELGRGTPDDAALVATTAWASFTAARRIARWTTEARGA